MPPILRRYCGQVVYETKRAGREWLMKVIFGRDNDTFRMVFSGHACVSMFIFTSAVY